MHLGCVDFDTLLPALLQTLGYNNSPIIGNNDATNQLVNGSVFAVRTNRGNFAKVQVLEYGYNLTLRWSTHKGAAVGSILLLRHSVLSHMRSF